LFDFYIFQHDPELLSHIPTEALGILGELKPDAAEALMSQLEHQLREKRQRFVDVSTRSEGPKPV
jgi:ABC-type transporter Mla MlaB component